MKKSICIYSKLVRLKLCDSIVYRSSFFLGIIGQWLSSGVNFITMYILVHSFKNVVGWNRHEMIFLYAFYLLSYSICGMFFYNSCTQLERKIRTGELDSILIKPTSSFLYAVFSEINIGYVSHIALSLLVLIYSAIKLGLVWSVSKIVLGILMLLGSIMIQNSIYVFASMSSFYIHNDNPIMNLIITELRNFSKYPLELYGSFIQFVFTILPFGFINYYPVIILLNKKSSVAEGKNLGYYTPIIGFVLFSLSVLFWNKCISSYQSTGS